MSARRWATALALTLALTGGACAQPEADDGTLDLRESTEELTVAEMGALGARVYREPERAEDLVREAGLTPAEFEARIRSITDDPNQSMVYADAFEAEVAETDDGG